MEMFANAQTTMVGLDTMITRKILALTEWRWVEWIMIEMSRWTIAGRFGAHSWERGWHFERRCSWMCLGFEKQSRTREWRTVAGWPPVVAMFLSWYSIKSMSELEGLRGGTCAGVRALILTVLSIVPPSPFCGPVRRALPTHPPTRTRTMPSCS